MKFTHIDLHCHSTASDGSLKPAEVVERAHGNGVEVLSLTDHDTIQGVNEAEAKAQELGMRLIPGIELSCVWQGHTIHILGLNFSVSSQVMINAEKQQLESRTKRARQIAEKLQNKLKVDLFDRALSLADAGVPGRPHFAQALVEFGLVKDQADAFKKYLGAGKIGDVQSHWPELAEIIDWILQAGGDAVIAHPRKYSMSLTKLRALIHDFQALGGAGIEVVVSGQKQGEVGMLSDLCQRFNLKGSVGSDFHSPRFPWADLGRVPPLPQTVTPVWDEWD